MKCTRLKLAERVRTARREPRNELKMEQPRRYCQKRMVNPDHEEDPRWSEAALERFRYQEPEEDATFEATKETINYEEQFLSVLNLQFPGSVQQPKRSRSCFKYTSKPNKGNKHNRMFIKQVVEEDGLEESRLSVDPNFYLDDYVSYIINRSESRPSTGKSSINFNRFGKENKAVQVDSDQNKLKTDGSTSLINKKTEKKTNDDAGVDTKISFHNVGKRKSLTISRAQSPETIQVIRVDVVCNNVSTASSITSGDEKKDCTEKIKLTQNLRNNNFANKYLLTSTVKSLDQNVGSGSKVTLLCKTFTLANRSNVVNKSKKINSHRK